MNWLRKRIAAIGKPRHRHEWVMVWGHGYQCWDCGKSQRGY